jgi:hypothetical protein
MTRLRWSGLILSLTAVLASGCGKATPAPVLQAENLALDCKFSIDGVQVRDFPTLVQSDTEHVIGVKFRLSNPEPYREGVHFTVRVYGPNSKGHLITYGHVLGTAKPDREGRVSFDARLRIPSREDEYELQLLLGEGNDKHLIARHGMTVRRE